MASADVHNAELFCGSNDEQSVCVGQEMPALFQLNPDFINSSRQLNVDCVDVIESDRLNYGASIRSIQHHVEIVQLLLRSQHKSHQLILLVGESVNVLFRARTALDHERSVQVSAFGVILV